MNLLLFHSTVNKKSNIFLNESQLYNLNYKYSVTLTYLLTYTYVYMYGYV